IGHEIGAPLVLAKHLRPFGLGVLLEGRNIVNSAARQRRADEHGGCERSDATEVWTQHVLSSRGRDGPRPASLHGGWKNGARIPPLLEGVWRVLGYYLPAAGNSPAPGAYGRWRFCALPQSGSRYSANLARRSFLEIFPVAVIGRASTKTTSSGICHLA